MDETGDGSPPSSTGWNLLQAEIDRAVPNVTHHDQHEALTNLLSQVSVRPTVSGAGAAPASAGAAPAAKRGVDAAISPVARQFVVHRRHRHDQDARVSPSWR
jgi:hypothetical protein